MEEWREERMEEIKERREGDKKRREGKKIMKEKYHLDEGKKE